MVAIPPHPTNRNLQDALHSAKREAVAGFGDDRVLLERFITRPRHIEASLGCVEASCLTSLEVGGVLLERFVAPGPRHTEQGSLQIALNISLWANALPTATSPQPPTPHTPHTHRPAGASVCRRPRQRCVRV